MSVVNVQALIQRYNKLKGVRDGHWLAVWREVRRLVYPTVSDFLPEGGERGADNFNPTAVNARSRLAAGMYNWMAPPDQRWFELAPEAEDLADDDEVKAFFGEVTKQIRIAMANSNWPAVLISCLNNLACGLDGVVYCEEGVGGKQLNFRCFDPEELCYSEDAWGKVDTVFREVKMTPRQMAQYFDTLPEKLASLASDEKKMDEKRTLLHAVFPRENRDERLGDNRNMPYADVYIDLETKEIVREGGFQEFPFAVCRFEKAANDTYGRGPGINLLPDIRQLMAMEEAYTLARSHQADPSYIAPDGSILSRNFNRDPGSLVIYKPTMDGGKPEMLPTNPNINTLYADIQEMQKRIEMGFFLDIFDPLGDLRNMTAAEAQIRNEAKMVPFAPIAGNMHNELFRVVLHRVFGILSRSGALPELPEKLLDQPDYKVEFVSKIALSIKKTETLALYEADTIIAAYAQRDPSVLDNFVADDIVRDTFLAHGAAPKWLRPVEERDQLRQERAAAEAQAAQQQALMEGASILGDNLGKMPEPGSPLSEVLNGKGV